MLSLLAHLPASVAGATRSVWMAWRARKAIGRLSALDDHMLRDLGLSRGDVETALRCAGLGDPSAHLVELRMQLRDIETRRVRAERRAETVAPLRRAA